MHKEDQNHLPGNICALRRILYFWNTIPQESFANTGVYTEVNALLCANNILLTLLPVLEKKYIRNLLQSLENREKINKYILYNMYSISVVTQFSCCCVQILYEHQPRERYEDWKTIIPQLSSLFSDAATRRV